VSGHLGDALSGLLDGELGEAEAADARRHLERCAACRGELAAVDAARRAVRALPMLAPPPGLFEVRRLPWWRGPAVGTVAAAAAAWLVVLGLGAGPDPRTAPALAGLLAGHRSATASVGAPLAGALAVPVTTLGGPPGTAAGPGGPWAAPAAMDGGWVLAGSVDRGDAVQLVYTDGRRDVSVFEQRGDLDWGGLPAGGRVVEVAGRRVWLADAGIHRVAVFEEDGIVVAVVADGPPEAAAATAGVVPRPGRGSWTDRARRAAQGLVDLFSLRD
jgi:hypothetical protein